MPTPPDPQVIETNELAATTTPRDGAGLARPGPLSINQLLRHAIDNDVSPDALNKLVDLYERVEGRNAAMEAVQALARFQGACPSVHKSSTAQIVTTSGSKYSYTYAKLDEIARTIRPYLAKEGLSYGWDSIEDSTKVEVVCTVRHINGHTFTAKAVAPTDSAAKMSGAQKNTAARTTAKRESLIQALGITTSDDDTDGVEPGGGGGVLSEDQAATIAGLILEVGQDTDKFLRLYSVKRIEDLPAVCFDGARQALEAKRKGKA